MTPQPTSLLVLGQVSAYCLGYLLNSSAPTCQAGTPSYRSQTLRCASTGDTGVLCHPSGLLAFAPLL